MIGNDIFLEERREEKGMYTPIARTKPVVRIIKECEEVPPFHAVADSQPVSLLSSKVK